MEISKKLLGVPTNLLVLKAKPFALVGLNSPCPLLSYHASRHLYTHQYILKTPNHTQHKDFRELILVSTQLLMAPTTF